MSLLRDAYRRASMAQGVNPPQPSYVAYSSLGFLDGDPFIVTSGTNVLMDQSSVKHSAIEINGTVTAPLNAAGRLWGDSIQINGGGALVVGTKAAPYTGSNFEVVLSGARPTTTGNPGGGALVTGRTHNGNTSTGNNGTTNDNYGLNRGLIVNPGGKLNLVGNPRAYITTRLNANWTAGTSITVADPVTVMAGEKIWMTPTGYFNSAQRTELLTVAADCINSTTIQLTQGPNFSRWGQMQYATDSGISTTPGTWDTKKAHAAMTPEIDQRAYVVIPKRNITVRPATDVETGTSAIATYGYGAHIMAMDNSALGTEMYLDGVYFPNFGQKGLLGRYAVHWHLTNYNVSTGAFYGAYAADKAVVRRCSFEVGHNRAIDIHAAAGVLVELNQGYRSLGHAFFEEDGSEQFNVVRSNWMFRTTDPTSTWALKNHDMVNSGNNGNGLPGFGPAGFWFANFNNVHQDNHGVDSDGVGWWNSISRGLDGIQQSSQYGCLGSSVKIPIAPFYGVFGTWDGNVAISNGQLGGVTDLGSFNNAGDLASNKIQTTTNGLAGPDYGNTAQVESPIFNAVLYMNPAGYANRISTPHYRGWKVADNRSAGLQGATDAGSADRMLFVKRSLNTLDGGTQPAVVNGAASYHGSVQFYDISHYGYAAGTPTAVSNYKYLLGDTAFMESWDLYLHPVENWMSAMTNWRGFNSQPMFLSPSPVQHSDSNLAPYLSTGNLGYDVTPPAAPAPYYRRGGVTSAMWDPNGTLTGTPNSYIIPDHPFFKTGVTFTDLGSGGLSLNKVATGTDFFGVSPNNNFTSVPTDAMEAAITFQKVNASNVDIAGATWVLPGLTGSYQAQYTFKFATVERGARIRTFSQDTNAVYSTAQGGMDWRFDNLFRSNDFYIHGVPWTGSVGYVQSLGSGLQVTYAAVSSLSALDAATTGVYWNDTANSMLWIRVVPISTNASKYFVDSQSLTKFYYLVIR